MLVRGGLAPLWRQYMHAGIEAAARVAQERATPLDAAPYMPHVDHLSFGSVPEVTVLLVVALVLAGKFYWWVVNQHGKLLLRS